ncbi:DUF6542 domain-containing protein [Streptomyces sp. NPDC059637]|uniref:DUF6542 domain-containing protein n=1 Tax=Streptomyces sp. NPDC059637 TaxID=3347752 RepID=UPI0036BC9082
MEHPSTRFSRREPRRAGRPPRLPRPAGPAAPGSPGSPGSPGTPGTPGTPGAAGPPAAQAAQAAPRRRTATGPPGAAAPPGGASGRGPRTGRAARAARPAGATRAGGGGGGGLSGPRLTAAGAAVVVGGLTAAGAALDALLLDGTGPVFKAFFVLACVAGALRVRPSDLLAPAVAAPLVFALAVLFTGTPGDGAAGRAMALFTDLAVNAGWLFLGTGLALAVAAARRLGAAVAARTAGGRTPPR